jgi:signal transduction histidine kinase
VLFVLLLPWLVNKVSQQYSKYYLKQQKEKVLEVIEKNSIDYYLQGDSSFGSYTMLKEEYISIIPADAVFLKDTIETSQRIIEGDTIDYRILIHPLNAAGNRYLLEIGKTTATIGEYNLLLQRFTLFALIGLIVLSIIIDLVYTYALLRPLQKIVNTRLTGQKFPFKVPLAPVKTSTTDFKYLDDALTGLMKRINEAFYKEREFTSNASHELMTPISILQTSIENMMLEENMTEGMQERLSSVMKTVSRLKKIVHALLHISRIENEQFAKDDNVLLHQVVMEIKEELDAGLQEKEIHFSNSLSPALKIKQVNQDLFFQLLYNLINNAIRYNKEKGSITVSEKYEGADYNICIADTGIGIRADEIPNIFNRFKRLQQAPDQSYGLGLSIVKTIARYHGFNIRVESVVDKGTVFILSIPSIMVEK